MIIRTKGIYSGYAKVDNQIAMTRNISDGAFRLYAYFIALKNGDNFVDKFIMKGLGISQATLTKRKKELKDAGLIASERLASREYILWVGDSQMPAKAFMAAEKIKISLRTQQQITPLKRKKL